MSDTCPVCAGAAHVNMSPADWCRAAECQHRHARPSNQMPTLRPEPPEERLLKSEVSMSHREETPASASSAPTPEGRPEGDECAKCGRLRHLHPAHPDCRVWVAPATPPDPPAGVGRSPATALAWALDLMEMYEARLIQFGDPAHLVNSAVHLAGKAQARRILSAQQAHERSATVLVDSSVVDSLRTALAAAEAARDEAHREIGRVIDRLDEFAPHNTGKGVAESVEELRTRLCVVRAEIEAKGGWRERLHAAKDRADGLEEALRGAVLAGAKLAQQVREWRDVYVDDDAEDPEGYLAMADWAHADEAARAALAAHGGKGTRHG